MPKITILWGKDPEPGDKAKTYTFSTDSELDAFKLGVEEMDGWAGYRETPEGFVVPKDGFDNDDPSM